MSDVPVDIQAMTAAQQLRVTWASAAPVAFPYVWLRGQCRCAACVDEWTGKPILDPATIDPGLRIAGIQPMGNYAIQIAWSDGHDTGIYTWKRLRELAMTIPNPADHKSDHA